MVAASGHLLALRPTLFDLLYHAGRCLLKEPLMRRRKLLAEACQRLDAVDVRFSEGVVGQGRALCAAALAQRHEGVIAKHLASTYRLGRRSSVRRKIKPRLQGNCQKREVSTY